MNVKNDARLVLIRGIPGSGKTTIAKNNFSDMILMEADMFFEGDGGYNYDHSKIKIAHQWCQRTTKNLLDYGYDVVVANTFTRVWEMQPYLDMGYPTTVITAVGEFRNTHGVPDDVVQIMKGRFEDFVL